MTEGTYLTELIKFRYEFAPKLNLWKRVSLSFPVEGVYVDNKFSHELGYSVSYEW